MPRDQSQCLGDCSKRQFKTEDNQMCDYFEPKRKSRYKISCRHCKFFTPIRLDQKKDKDQEV